MSEKFKNLREILGEISDLASAASVLGWDQQTYMPKGGAAERAMQLSTLSRLAHERLTSDELGDTLEEVAKIVGDLDSDSDEARLVRKTKHDFDKQRKVPSKWVGEYARVTALAHQAWEKAREDSDFAHFEPHLEKVFELRYQYADFFAPFDHPYDPLLDDFETGMKTVDVKAVFEALRPQQIELVHEIAERGRAVDDAVIHQHFDERKQWDFGIEVVKAFGYDFDRGRQDKAVHPFTTKFGSGDVRITTRFDPNFFNTGIFSTMHEAGHAMYEQGVNPEFSRTPIAEGTSLGMHESQSRMWENLVGRSKAFWVGFYPRLQETFPSQLGNVDLDTFYSAINKVEPSLIRVEADEATYNLHIMLRFEIELALIEKKLAVHDLPQVWNSKMEEFLGITPPDDAQGVLQDVHWSSGLLGYFPTYAIGNLIASQLWEKIEQDIPDIEHRIENSEFDTLLDWLRENIHKHGAKYEPMELLQRVAGNGLTAEPYVRYLRKKFGDIYAL